MGTWVPWDGSFRAPVGLGHWFASLCHTLCFYKVPLNLPVPLLLLMVLLAVLLVLLLLLVLLWSCRSCYSTSAPPTTSIVNWTIATTTTHWTSTTATAIGSSCCSRLCCGYTHCTS